MGLPRLIFQSSEPMTFPKKRSLKKSSKMEMEPNLRQEKLVNVGQQPDTEVTVSADMEGTVTDTNTYMALAWIITLLNTITESACGIWPTKIQLSKMHT